MKKLTKKYSIVYYKDSKLIVFKITNGSPEFPVFPAADTESEEFDTEQELEDYISENNLVEIAESNLVE